MIVNLCIFLAVLLAIISTSCHVIYVVLIFIHRPYIDLDLLDGGVIRYRSLCYHKYRTETSQWCYVLLCVMFDISGFKDFISAKPKIVLDDGQSARVIK